MPLRVYAAIARGDPHVWSALRGLETARERMDYLGWAVRESHRAMGDLAKECQTGAFAHRIFMAPEYYFANRRYENDRFFSHDLKRWIIGKLYKLGDLYPNLLIIPGTVLWTKSLRQEKVAKLEDNVAWAKGVGVQTMSEGASHTPGASAVYSAGLDGGPPKVNLAKLRETKTLIAQNTAYICLTNQILKYHKVGNYNELQGEQGSLVFRPGSIQGTFSIGGIKYGLEVCMDHSLDVLKSPVDIHLIVSSYVDFRQTSAKLVLHASTQKPGPYTVLEGGKPKVQHASTDPVRLTKEAKVVGVKTLRSEELSVYAFDIDSLNPDRTLKLRDPVGQVTHFYDAAEIERRITSTPTRLVNLRHHDPGT